MDPIELSTAEIVSGIEFSNQYRQLLAQADAAKRAEALYIEHLRRVHGAPAGWTVVDWMVGFVPPQGEQHGHNHD
jgi:hypothetical protein